MRIRDFHPGSEFFHPGYRIQGKKDSESRIRVRTKEFKVFQPKHFVLSSRKYDPGCLFRIPDSNLDFLPIPNPGVKKTPDPGSGTLLKIRTWNESWGSRWPSLRIHAGIAQSEEDPFLRPVSVQAWWHCTDLILEKGENTNLNRWQQKESWG